MIPNLKNTSQQLILVVNCFQNCIFTYDSQQLSTASSSALCCELLSELYFYLWFPTAWFFSNYNRMLWIAFRIVFLLMIPNRIYLDRGYNTVVNCFQNCIFTYDSQLNLYLRREARCCELLSELYFYLWFPTKRSEDMRTASCELLSELYFYLWFPTKGSLNHWTEPLWIAFRIVFLLMIPNPAVLSITPTSVVNCFQNCIFTYDSQHKALNPTDYNGCELLSELYFYLWFPTMLLVLKVK